MGDNSKDVADQVADMFDAPVGDAPADDTDDTDTDDAVDTDVTDDIGDDSDDDAADDSDDPVDPNADLRAENARLSGRIDTLVAMMKDSDAPADKPEPEEPELMDFIGDGDVADIITDPKKLNALLQKVYARAREDSLRDLPNLIQGTVTRNAGATAQVTKFYTDNPDLKRVAPYVKVIANEVVAANPGMPIAQLLPLIAKRTRSDLELTKKSKDIDDKTPGRTPTPGGGNRPNRKKKGDKNLDPQQRQIATMLGSPK